MQLPRPTIRNNNQTKNKVVPIINSYIDQMLNDMDYTEKDQYFNRIHSLDKKHWKKRGNSVAKSSIKIIKI